ncbi:unnamed protein product [Linum trigynum]|uniref:Secreted protein n=1 Tax=Linum trigynum TaxID=586398 RepID=A0AAV2EF86_9ROSI
MRRVRVRASFFWVLPESLVSTFAKKDSNSRLFLFAVDEWMRSLTLSLSCRMVNGHPCVRRLRWEWREVRGQDDRGERTARWRRDDRMTVLVNSQSLVKRIEVRVGILGFC